MIVKTQDDVAFYDLDKLVCVYAFEDEETGKAQVLALSYTSPTAYSLGTYKNKERAKEVVGEIFSLYNTDTLYTMPII